VGRGGGDSLTDLSFRSECIAFFLLQSVIEILHLMENQETIFAATGTGIRVPRDEMRCYIRRRAWERE
jgi:hypothetical protein